MNTSFESFWNLYGKKVGDKRKVAAIWASLTDKDRSDIMEHIPKYILVHPTKRFRIYPETYLDMKAWRVESAAGNELSEKHSNIVFPIASVKSGAA